MTLWRWASHVKNTVSSVGVAGNWGVDRAEHLQT